MVSSFRLDYRGYQLDMVGQMGSCHLQYRFDVSQIRNFSLSICKYKIICEIACRIGEASHQLDSERRIALSFILSVGGACH